MSRACKFQNLIHCVCLFYVGCYCPLEKAGKNLGKNFKTADMVDFNYGNFCRHYGNFRRCAIFLIYRVVMYIEISNETTIASTERIISVQICQTS